MHHHTSWTTSSVSAPGITSFVGVWCLIGLFLFLLGVTGKESTLPAVEKSKHQYALNVMGWHSALLGRLVQGGHGCKGEAMGDGSNACYVSATSHLLHHDGGNECHLWLSGGETEASVSENCGQDLKMRGLSLKLLCSCPAEFLKEYRQYPLLRCGDRGRLQARCSVLVNFVLLWRE